MIENRFKESLRNHYKKYMEMKKFEKDTTEQVTDAERDIFHKLMSILDLDDEYV